MLKTEFYRVFMILACCLTVGVLPSSLQAAPELEYIQVQLKWKHSFQFAGYYMAIAKGYYREAGLDVRLIEGQEGQSPVEFVLGQANRYAITDSGVLIAYAEGKPIKALTATFQHSPLALMVLESSGIKNISDLRDKRIMFQTLPQGASITAMLQKHQLSPNKDFDRQTNSMNIQDLIDGHTDAFSVYTFQQPFTLKKQGIPFRIFYPQDDGVDFYGDIMISSHRELENNPQRVHAFLKATQRGWNDAVNHPSEAVDVILATYNTLQYDRETLNYQAQAASKLMMKELVPVGYMSEQRWDTISREFINLGLIAPEFSAEGFVYKPKQDGVFIYIRHHPLPFIIALLLIIIAITLINMHIMRRTLRKRTAKLKDNETYLQSIIDLAEIGVILHRDGLITYVNPYILKRMQVESWDEVEDKRVLTYIHPGDHAALAQRTQAAQKGEAFHRIPVRYVNAEKKYFDFEVSGMLIDYQGSPITLVTALDVTERKAAESERAYMQRQVEHSQRLESLGVLAGGIAHDFNNLLTAILGNASLAANKIESKLDEAQQHLQRVIQSSESAATLCQQMLAYSGQGKFVIQPVNLTDVLKDMMPLLEFSIEKNAAVHYHLDDELPAVNADVTQLKQVMMNLVINASEAIEHDHGEIMVRSGVMHAAQDLLNSCHYGHDKLHEGDFVFIEVQDNGSGMNAVTLEKVFEPFFTTKFTGRGLGMSAILGIIRGHHGAIFIDSAVGKGSCVKVLLPIKDGGKAYRQQLPSPNHTHHTPVLSGCVLLVDDEKYILETVGAMLEHLNIRTITASSGEEAVTLYREQGETIDVVILDITMPGMGGEEALMQLVQWDADVQVVMSSGYAEVDIRERLGCRHLAGFLQKPYAQETLRQCLLATERLHQGNTE